MRLACRLRAKRNTVQRSSLMGIRPRGLCERRGGDFDAWVLSRVLRRTARAQGASSGSTFLVFVVQITRSGAANPGWRGRSACAFFGRSTPGYLLSGLQPEEPGTGGTQKRGQVQFYRAAEPGAGAKTRLRKRRAEG
jgi:hypothetical protein